MVNKDNKAKANISFRCYGLYFKEPYTIKSGDYAGDTVTPIGGVLSHIYYISINGEVMYRSKKDGEDNSDTDNQVSNQSQSSAGASTGQQHVA